MKRHIHGRFGVLVVENCFLLCAGDGEYTTNKYEKMANARR